MNRLLLLVVVSCWLVFACGTSTSINKKQKDPQTKSTVYQPTVLPEDISKLWLTEGNPTSDTVYIISQGGPREFLYFERDGRVIWRYLPTYKNKLIVHLHQSQTYNSQVFKYRGDFTPAMAQQEIDQTSLMIDKAILHFKNKGKHVVAIGHSYGAFCIIDALINGKSRADRYLISAVRIKDDPEAVRTKLTGINGGYQEDGTTYIIDDLEEIKKNRTTNELKAYKIKQLLKGTLGKTNYSNKLKDIDLSNATFVYSKNDNRVGKMTKEEIDLLESRNAQVLTTTGDHGSVVKRVIDAVMDGTIKL